MAANYDAVDASLHLSKNNQREEKYSNAWNAQVDFNDKRDDGISGHNDPCTEIIHSQKEKRRSRKRGNKRRSNSLHSYHEDGAANHNDESHSYSSVPRIHLSEAQMQQQQAIVEEQQEWWAKRYLRKAGRHQVIGVYVLFFFLIGYSVWLARSFSKLMDNLSSSSRGYAHAKSPSGVNDASFARENLPHHESALITTEWLHALLPAVYIPTAVIWGYLNWLGWQMFAYN